MSTATVTVRGVPLEVDYTYLPFHRGSRNSFGAPEEPDEPEDVEIDEIRCEGWEIMCFFDDSSISQVRREILALRGEE